MPRTRTRVLRLAAASALASVLATGLLTTLVAAPASAHDALVDSTPAAGDVLDTAPTEITLTYSADVIDGSASVAVVDTAGTDWTDGAPVVAGTDVTVPLKTDLPDGAYEVRWRVASSDGHPIDGSIPFTVGDAAPATQTTPEPSETPLIAPAPPASGGDGVARTVLIGAGGALAALAVFVVVLIVRRRGAGKSES